jgi:hypothetical protein
MLLPVGTGYVRRNNMRSCTAYAGERGEIEGHPQIRRDRHASSRQPQRHAEALAFHQAIGVERKAARFGISRFGYQAREAPASRFQQPQPNMAWGLANVSLVGVDVSKAYDFWTKYRIITAAIKRTDYQGLRVTPNVY